MFISRMDMVRLVGERVFQGVPLPPFVIGGKDPVGSKFCCGKFFGLIWGKWFSAFVASEAADLLPTGSSVGGAATWAVPPIMTVGGDGADGLGDAPETYGKALPLGFLDDGVSSATKLGCDGVA